MTRPVANWDDLRQRLLTGALLVAAGITVIAIGGWTFKLASAAICGIMVWELFRMIAPERRGRAQMIGVLGAVVLIAARLAPELAVVPLLLVPPVMGYLNLDTRRKMFAAFSFGILFAGYGLGDFRDDNGVVWLFWLVIVVVVTDIAGYFAGRTFGGPKFWPRVSPKKTWSGIVAGWIAAGVTGAVFLTFTNAGRDLIWISMFLSFASQMGDMAQSAVKRRVGVKDSSSLLPGHGGLWDRFDALLGAALVMLFIAQVVDVPEVRF